MCVYIVSLQSRESRYQCSMWAPLRNKEMLDYRGFALQGHLESRRQTSPFFLLSPPISDDSSSK